ncbi:MAG: M23 family metallopeptidase [Clostridia bacterium]|nr:M23 family metallopeptidase [Clostridia bacterium]
MSLRIDSSEKKRSSPKKKPGRNLSFYAAILLCAGAVVLTAVTNRADSGDTAPDALTSGQSSHLPFDDIPAVDETLTDSRPIFDVTVTSTDIRPAALTTTASSPEPTEAPSRMNVTEAAPAIPDAVPASAPVRFRMPTGGEFSSGFSGDELVFCATMCDWRVHNGVDITGESGAEVIACADGIVENFAADILYGNTAIIRHADDSIMYYSGLSDTKMVSPGLEVHAGDVIGYIGEVPCELDDGPHIHLTMVKDGKFIDPAPLLGVQ